MVLSLISPAEMMLYLEYRQVLFEMWGGRLNLLSEAALVGHYVSGRYPEEEPREEHRTYLAGLNSDIEDWDISGIIRNYEARIRPVAKVG